MFFPLFFPLLEDYTTHTYAHIKYVHIPKRITYSILIILLPNPSFILMEIYWTIFIYYKQLEKPKRFVLTFVMLSYKKFLLPCMLPN